MLLPQANFDPETVALMGRACDEAWRELERRRGFILLKTDDVKVVLAHKIMTAVYEGERDHERLKQAALNAVNGRSVDE